MRLEFIGDTIESIRQFDPATQRSVAALDRVTIAPVRETADTLEAREAERPATSSVTSDGRRACGSSSPSSTRCASAGDYVVHVDHGVGALPRMKRPRRRPVTGGLPAPGVRWAATGRMYVPVDRDRVGKCHGQRGQGRAHARTTSGATVECVQGRDVRSATRHRHGLPMVYSAREVLPWTTPYSPDATWQAEIDGSLPLRRDGARRAVRGRQGQGDLGGPAADGPADLRRRRLRQDRGRDARGVQGGDATASRWPCWSPTTVLGAAALRDLPRALRRHSRSASRCCQPLPHARRTTASRWPASPPATSTSSSARIACCRRTSSFKDLGLARHRRRAALRRAAQGAAQASCAQPWTC